MSLSAIHMMKPPRARLRDVVTGLDEETLYAIAFNNIHEGIHFGVILTRLKKP